MISGGMAAHHDGFSSSPRDPVAEPLRGLRLFEVSGDSLTGIFKRTYRWQAGVNEASCLRQRNGPPLTDAMTLVEDDGTVRVVRHELLAPDCDCGFWAYTNGTQQLVVYGPTIFGVVEGWGRMVVGPAGFRSEKARILGLASAADVDIDVGVVDASETLAAAVAKILGPALTSFFGLDQPAEQPSGPVTDVTVASALAERYEVPLFPSVTELVRAFPLSDTRPLVDDVESGDGS